MRGRCPRSTPRREPPADRGCSLPGAPPDAHTGTEHSVGPPCVPSGTSRFGREAGPIPGVRSALGASVAASPRRCRGPPAGARAARPGDRLGPGAAARAVAARLRSGHIVAVDRSAAAVALARTACAAEIASGRQTVRQCAAEDFAAEPGEGPFDLVFAFRVGALDGRHPASGRRVPVRIGGVLAPEGRLFIDGGDPLREVRVPR
nr:methyltransferase domain-containing protein [Streptomyces sp. YIM 130001]